MTDGCSCSDCGADWRDKPIPPDDLHLYGGNATCDDCGEARHFSRRIAFYETYRDRTISWQCPDCGHTEER